MNDKLLFLSYLKNKQNGNQEFVAFRNSIRKNSNLKTISLFENTDNLPLSLTWYPDYLASSGQVQRGSRLDSPPPGDRRNWIWNTEFNAWQWNGNPNDNFWQWDQNFGAWTITINGVVYVSLGGDSPIVQSGPQQIPEQLDGWSEYFTSQGLPEWPWWDFLSQLETAISKWLWEAHALQSGMTPDDDILGQIRLHSNAIAIGFLTFFGADIAAYIIANNLGAQLISGTNPNIWMQILNAFQPGSSSIGAGAWNTLSQVLRGIQSGQSLGALFTQGGAVNGVTMGTLIRSLALAGIGVGAILSIVASWWHIYNLLQDPNWDSSTPPPISHKEIWNFLRQPVPQVESPESLAPTPTVIPGGYPGAPGPSGAPPNPYTDMGPYLRTR